MMGQQTDMDKSRSAEQQPLINQVISYLARVPSYIASHPVGFWFIFWGELAEPVAITACWQFCLRYMSEQLMLGDKAATEYSSYFKAGCYLLPLVGGFLADRFFGKYRTIVGFTLPYIAGMVILSLRTSPAWL